MMVENVAATSKAVVAAAVVVEEEVPDPRHKVRLVHCYSKL